MRTLNVFFLSLFLFGACSNPESEISDIDAAEKQEILRLEVESLIDSITKVSDIEVGKALSIELLDKAENYVNQFPRDKSAAKYLFVASRAAIGQGEYNKAIELMDRILKRYKNYNRTPEVLFLKAFTLDEDMNQKEKAKAAYLDLIEQFPRDPLAEQAELMLENLYLTDEELIKKFQKQNP